MKLNLACGSNKIEGYLNCDIEKSCNPDRFLDFSKPLPLEDNSVEVILLFHAIEHVQKQIHVGILSEFHRVLASNGKLIISYPEFSKIAKNWLENARGMREFWEHTIYGLQRYPNDFHIALMHTPEFIEKLRQQGFDNIEVSQEPQEDYNTVVRCRKGEKMMTYEDVVRKEIFG